MLALPALLAWGEAAAAAPARKALVLYSNHDTLPWQGAVRGGLFARVRAMPELEGVQIFEERLDQIRLGHTPDAETTALLSARYARAALDLVITEDDGAYLYLRRHPELFAGVRRLHMDAAPTNETDAASTIVLRADFAKSLELITRLVPERRHVVLVGNGYPLINEGVAAAWRRGFADRLQLERWDGELDLDELLARAARLPPDALILYSLVTHDRSGARHVPRAVLQRLAAAASVPVFIAHNTLLGIGAVGGHLSSGERAGAAIAELIAGTEPGAIDNERFFTYEFDHAALQRWRIDESRLPPGSVVHGRPLGFWQRHGESLRAFAPLVLLQTVLLVWLAWAYRALRRTTGRLNETVVKLDAERRRSEEASVAKSAFLANTSHEIRTPLHAILGLAYLLERSALAEPALHRVRQIALAGRSLLGLLDDVLDLTKIESGQLDLEEQDFDLAALLNEEINLQGEMARARSLAVTLELDAGLPRRVRGDPTRVRQIVTNLLGNAVKFTERGSVRVVVRRGAAEPLLTLDFIDTGIGIAPEVQSRLFQPFTQADASTTRRYGGSGLGLSIARRLVERMGGTIGLSSQPGLGSTFTVTLPLPEAPTDGDEDAAPAAALRVLLADDDAVQLESLAAMARSLGWQTATAGGGEALVSAALAAALQDRPFDALVVDWQMPDLDGLSALARLQERLPDGVLPASVVVSVHEIERLRQAPHAELASSLLVKPVSGSTLFNAVNQSVARLPGQAHRLLDASQVGLGDMMWLHGVRVLVADDSALNLDVARHVLEGEGAEVQTCTGGEQALALLRADPDGFDVVLMDVQMPDLDGNQATQRMRADPALATIPVIAMTAGVQGGARARSAAAGMNDFLGKPLEPRRLIRCLRRHVELYRGSPIALVARPDGGPVDEAFEPLPVDGIDAATIAPAVRRDRALVLSMLRRLLDEFADLHASPGGTLPARLHKLRGSASAVGAVELARQAAEAERLLQRSPQAPVADRLSALQARLDRLAESAAPLLRAEAERLAAAETAARQQAASAAAPLDAAALHELAAAIDRQSLQALEQFEALAGPLGAALPASELSALRGALHDFDFAAARSILARMPR